MQHTQRSMRHSTSAVARAWHAFSSRTNTHGVYAATPAVIGVMMCELLTGKSARDAAAALEDVFEDTSTNNAEQASAALQPLLDPAARWPTATAVEFAGMAAACLQAARRRPNLQSGLQPMFEKMLAAATATATVSVEAPVQHTRSAGQQQVLSEHHALPAASSTQIQA